MALAVHPCSVYNQTILVDAKKDDSFEKDVRDDIINVFLQMWDGKTLCCTINPRKAAIINIISVFETKVLNHYPGEENNFYFCFNGKPLNSQNCNFSNSVVLMRNGSTVFVQYRNRGGCFVISFTILVMIMTAIIGSTCTCGLSLVVVPLLLPFLFVLPLFCL